MKTIDSEQFFTGAQINNFQMFVYEFKEIVP